MNYDLEIFRLLNGLATRFFALDCTALFFAEYSQYLLIIILLFLFIYPQRWKTFNRHTIIITLTSSFIIRFGVKAFILLFYNRPRPYMILTDANKLISIYRFEDYQSFPSGHTLFLFTLSTLVYCFSRETGKWFLLVALITGVARVFVGVHWPSDIIGGAAIGIISGWIVFLFYRSYKNKIDSILTRVFKI